MSHCSANPDSSEARATVPETQTNTSKDQKQRRLMCRWQAGLNSSAGRLAQCWCGSSQRGAASLFRLQQPVLLQAQAADESQRTNTVQLCKYSVVWRARHEGPLTREMCESLKPSTPGHARQHLLHSSVLQLLSCFCIHARVVL